jgi:RNA recognition motif-containing protein
MNPLHNNQIEKNVLFISELPDNIKDSQLEDFFKDYKDNIVIIQIDRSGKMYDYFNSRKPKATIIFKDHEKAKEARENLNMRNLNGKALNIMWHEKDNSIRYNNTANVFIKNIPKDVKPREIFEMFNKFGEIISTKICEDEDGNLLGYGYVNYYNLDSAEKAIKELNKKEINGCKLEVTHFQKKNERFQNSIANNSIYIKNIPPEKTIDDIKNIFKKFGNIKWGEINEDPNKRKYAILEFDNQEIANKAKEEMNEKNVFNTEIPLYVDLLQKKAERKRYLVSKIGDINNKLNQENKNCNLYIKNLPKKFTEQNLKELFEKYGEIKSVKIQRFINVIKEKDEYKEYVESCGVGFVCFTDKDNAKKAMEELNDKKLPGYEDEKNPPIFVTLFMPKLERKQFLNKIQVNNPNQRIPLLYPYLPPPTQYINMPFYQQMKYNNGRMHKKNNPHVRRNNNNNNNNIENVPKNKEENEDVPSLEFLNSLPDDKKKDYIGEFLFKAIQSHEISVNNKLDIDIIGRITGMILDIKDFNEIFKITTNPTYLTERINEALNLIKNSNENR